MARELFLHVGAPKTGTSTIQCRLEACSEYLCERSITYPVGFNGSFTYPHKGFISTGNVNPLAYAMRFPTDRIQYKNFELADVLEKLAEHVKGKDLVILSHEDLLYASVEFLGTIKDWAENLGFRVRPVIYIRDQISWHISNYQQHVRQLMATDTIYQIVGKSMQGPDWERYTNKFATLFGRDAVIVKLHKKSKDRDSTEAFLDSLGLGVTGLPEVKSADSNVGISVESAMIVSGFSKHSNDRVKQASLLKILSDCEAGKSRFLFPWEVQELLVSYYRQSNENLSKKYLSEEDASELNRLMLSRSTTSSPPIELATIDLASKALSSLL